MITVRKGRAVVLGALALFVAGCSTGPPLPPAANPDEARVALTTALEAWKKGGNAREELAARTPPIYFNDPRCGPDVKLIAYQLDESHTGYGQSVQITVVLSFQKDGRVVEKKVSYLVDTAPAIVIVPG